MTSEDARSLIVDGVPSTSGTWADIGAGTGTFTLALQSILTSGTIYATDKNPHALWSLESSDTVIIEIRELDFTRPFDLPPLDGIIMANALHYASDAVTTLKNVLTPLKDDGVLILIEYETKTPRPQWIPYPVPYHGFKEIAKKCGLTNPEKLAHVSSRYGHEHIYSVRCRVH